MKRLLLTALASLLAHALLRAQAVSINTDGSNPAPSAILDVKSTDKGMLVPRMTTAQRTLIAAPATGLLVFDTDSGTFWFYNGAAWTKIVGSSGIPATFIADTDGNTKVQTEKNPNEDIIRFDLGGSEKMALTQNANGTPRLELSNANFNTAIGEEALKSNTTGSANTATGFRSLSGNTSGGANTATGVNALFSNTTGNNNTAHGSAALFGNTDGSNNTALGVSSLRINNTGYNNTATGISAMNFNTDGHDNTANGIVAMYSNTSGFFNTAIGARALYANTTGSMNVAVGTSALRYNTTQSQLVAVGDSALFNNGLGAAGLGEALYNTAVGSKALFSNTTGSSNTAHGYQALYANSSGEGNTAMGSSALFSNTTGNSNTAIGTGAMTLNTTGGLNTACGFLALYSNSSGIYNTALGHGALIFNTTGNSNTANGISALYANTTGNYNTALGTTALSYNTIGFGNTGIGADAGDTSATNQYATFIGYDADYAPGGIPDVWYSTALGYSARVTADNQVRIGNSGTTSIGGYQNWTNISDGRYKNQVREDVGGLDFIRRLRPITYQLDVAGLARYLGESTPEGAPEGRGTPKDQIRYTGFIAQEVEAAARLAGCYPFSGVDAPQNPGGLYGLRYAEFTVPLVKAVQEMDAEAAKQREEMAALKAENAALRAQVEAQATAIQQITVALKEAGIAEIK